MTKDIAGNVQPGFNQDIFPTEQVLGNYPTLRVVLANPELQATFARADRQAASAKKAYVRLGIASLFATALALLGEVVALISHAHSYELGGLVEIAIHGAPLVAILIVAANRLGNFRNRWLQSTFLRERLRQWHFQTLLDGPRVERSLQAGTNREELSIRGWSSYAALEADPSGTLSAFLARSSVRLTKFGEGSAAAADGATRRALFDALVELRLNHQLRFAERKLAESAAKEPSLKETDRWTEIAAGSSLFIALTASCAASFVYLFGSANERDLLNLGAIALCLTVVSATLRSVRVGLTLPSELDSYQQYADEVTQIGERWSRAGSEAEMLALLSELEGAAANELRTFLRIKDHSRFLL